MPLDSRRLGELSGEVDQLHHESMRTVREQFGELHFGRDAAAMRDARRGFLKKAVASGAVIGFGSLAMPVGRLMPAAWGQEEGEGPPDGELARFAASLELAAVAVYAAAAETGLLTASVASAASLFRSHHGDHAEALNGVLEDAGAETVEEPNQAALDQFSPQISSASDEAAVLEIAYQVEEGAAATYLFAIGALEDPGNAGTLATILPVESQHATVIGIVLDKPTSEYDPAFLSPADALRPEDFPAGTSDDTGSGGGEGSGAGDDSGAGEGSDGGGDSDEESS